MLSFAALHMADQWGGLILPALLKSSLLLGILFVVARAMRSGSAAARHLVWFFGVCGLLLLPLLEAGLPALRVMPLPDLAPVSRAQTAPAPAVRETALPSAPVLEPALRPTVRPAPLGQASPAGHSVLFAAWLLGGLVLGVAALHGRLRLRRLRRGARPLEDETWTGLLEGLAREAQLPAPPHVLCSSHARTPLTWGMRRPIILLPIDCRQWSVQKRCDVLRHELAHIQRRDCLTQLAAHLACVIYWFNPLVWIAARQMRIERERACDDRVLLAGAAASTYASHLLEIARGRGSQRCLLTGSLAMAQRSRVYERLAAILDPRQRRQSLGRMQTLLVAGLVLAVLLPLATVHAEQIPAHHVAATTIEGYRTEDSQRRSRLQIKEDGAELKMEMQGEIEFSSDDRDVVSMGPGASLRLEKKKGWSREVLEIHADEAGRPQYTYKKGRSEHSYDKQAAEQWSAILARILLKTGIHAQTRVARAYAGEGLPGIFHILDQLDSDHVRGIYFSEALALPDLSEAEVAEILTRLPRDIRSDYERAWVLTPFSDVYLKGERAQEAFLACMAAMASDYEKSQVLQAGLHADDLTLDEIAVLLTALGTIRSDYEGARALCAFDPDLLADDEIGRLYCEAFGTIRSDYEKANVLTVLARRARSDAHLRDLCLRAADGIRSPHEHERIMRVLR